MLHIYILSDFIQLHLLMIVLLLNLETYEEKTKKEKWEVRVE